MCPGSDIHMEETHLLAERLDDGPLSKSGQFHISKITPQAACLELDSSVPSGVEGHIRIGDTSLPFISFSNFHRYKARSRIFSPRDNSSLQRWLTFQSGQDTVRRKSSQP